MIRIAVESDFSTIPQTESAVRIHGLKIAYGLEMSFLHFYSDGEGALLAIMDGVGILDSPSQLSDEWITFLLMNSDIRIIHCPEQVGRCLINYDVFKVNSGIVMIYEGGETESSFDIEPNPYLPAVYDLLSNHFEGISEFNAWYPDASHRVRHDCCHVSCVLDKDMVISTAMTVAETDSAVIIGQVATHPDYRRKGLAERCVKSLIYKCKGKQLYILPLNENARQLYNKIGFRDHSEWIEFTKQF